MFLKRRKRTPDKSPGELCPSGASLIPCTIGPRRKLKYVLSLIEQTFGEASLGIKSVNRLKTLSLLSIFSAAPRAFSSKRSQKNRKSVCANAEAGKERRDRAERFERFRSRIGSSADPREHAAANQMSSTRFEMIHEPRHRRLPMDNALCGSSPSHRSDERFELASEASSSSILPKFPSLFETHRPRTRTPTRRRSDAERVHRTFPFGPRLTRAVNS